MLDVHVYEITNSLTRNMGLQIPNNFQLFNIPAGALAALAGQNIQDLINQLISGGGINQSNSQALSGLLAQLQNQQSSVFSQPAGNIRQRPDAHGTEPGNSGGPAVAEREHGKITGARHAARCPGHRCDVSRGREVSHPERQFRPGIQYSGDFVRHPEQLVSKPLSVFQL